MFPTINKILSLINQMKKERYKIVPSSYLILMQEGKILLLRRFNTGYEDGKYGLVAGHVEENEAFRQALVREVGEEADISIDPADLDIVHVMHRKCPADERVDVFMSARKWEGEPENMEPHKCDDIRWFDMDGLPANTIPYIRQAVECIQKGVFYSEFGW